jgi:sulfofructose kinase
MNPHWDILGLGSATVDDLLFVTAFPQPDHKYPILHSERQGGGLTATALVAAARLGARCAFAGVIGRDEISKWVIDDLAREGLDVSQAVVRDDAWPIHAHIIVEREGHTRTILYEMKGKVGADDELPDADIIRAARVLLVDDIGVPGQIRAARIAREAGIPIVGDVEGHEAARLSELVELIDHLIVSLRYARTINGVSDPVEAARLLWHERRALVAITHGASGCWYTTDGKTIIHQPAFQVKAVDTTGCGDVFHGAYAAALTWGLPVPERIRFAAATAALKATQPGGRRGIPTRQRVEEFLRERG